MTNTQYKPIVRGWATDECKRRNECPNATYDDFSISELMSGRYKFSDYKYFDKYTGLKDKNGKEIYEGDVVQAKDGEGGRFNMPVVYADENFGNPAKNAGFHLQNAPKHYWELSPNTIITFGIEIIGNIYENPELLTQNKND